MRSRVPCRLGQRLSRGGILWWEKVRPGANTLTRAGTSGYEEATESVVVSRDPRRRCGGADPDSICGAASAVDP